jgi:hypothetical protein
MNVTFRTDVLSPIHSEATMATLTQASQQWMTRPADERFLSLDEMAKAMRDLRDRSHSTVRTTRGIEAVPDATDSKYQGLLIKFDETVLAPTHHSFGQLCSLSSPSASPAKYFRESRLPAPLVADQLNYNFRFNRKVEKVGILATDGELRALTGPAYGRVWNAEVVDMLADRFGDGVTGDWRVPGEFGNKVVVNRENTTLYASDRDMFVFLADEDRRIEVPGRRDGKSGSLARGFFVWNSEVGEKALGAGFFLFDYVCSNRMVWGAGQYTELSTRHTKDAYSRWLEEVVPLFNEFARASTKPVEQAIAAARKKKLDKDDLDQFLAGRFGNRMMESIKTIHEQEEGRPIETWWDVTVAATAVARSLPNTDRRVEVERVAGNLLNNLAA